MILRPNNKLRSLPSNKSQFTMVINLMGFRPEDLFFLFFSLAACHYEDFLLPRRNEERKKKVWKGKLVILALFSADSWVLPLMVAAKWGASRSRSIANIVRRQSPVLAWWSRKRKIHKISQTLLQSKQAAQWKSALASHSFAVIRLLGSLLTFLERWEE